MNVRFPVAQEHNNKHRICGINVIPISEVQPTLHLDQFLQISLKVKLPCLCNERTFCGCIGTQQQTRLQASSIQAQYKAVPKIYDALRNYYVCLVMHLFFLGGGLLSGLPVWNLKIYLDEQKQHLFPSYYVVPIFNYVK